jgi:molybdate transport system substrate-binding protein
MPRFASFLLATCAVAAASLAQSAEVAVLSGGAMKSGLVEAMGAWEKRTGNTVKATYAPAGEILKRLAAGERYDIVVMPVENFEALERDGIVAPGARRALAGVSIGVAVKKGAPVPDISTPEAVKRMLVEAKSVTYMDPTRGTSGKFVDEVMLPKLGVRDAVRAKTRFGEGGMIAEKVARGEVEVALHQYTEILPVEGVTPVGLLPPELQKVSVYTGAVTRTASAPGEAAALLDFLASAEGRRPLPRARLRSALSAAREQRRGPVSTPVQRPRRSAE